jgi:hypothetical protein
MCQIKPDLTGFKRRWFALQVSARALATAPSLCSLKGWCRKVTPVVSGANTQA